VIVISADTSALAWRAAQLATGRIDVLEKPFHLQVLRGKIERLLAKS